MFTLKNIYIFIFSFLLRVVIPRKNIMSTELNCREDMSDVDKYWVLGVLGVAQECCSRSDQMDYTLLYSTKLHYSLLY